MRTIRRRHARAGYLAGIGVDPLAGDLSLMLISLQHCDDLVCLEGNLRLTAHALAGFPSEDECVVGTTPALERWAQ